MNAFNATSKQTLGKATLLTSFLSKAKGLMFKKKCDQILIFDFKRESIRGAAIHSFFCPKFEAIYLDSAHRVVSMQTVLPATRRVAPPKPARYLLECPPGTISSSRTARGDVIKWK